MLYNSYHEVYIEREKTYRKQTLHRPRPHFFFIPSQIDLKLSRKTSINEGRKKFLSKRRKKLCVSFSTGVWWQKQNDSPFERSSSGAWEKRAKPSEMKKTFVRCFDRFAKTVLSWFVFWSSRKSCWKMFDGEIVEKFSLAAGNILMTRRKSSKFADRSSEKSRSANRRVSEWFGSIVREPKAWFISTRRKSFFSITSGSNCFVFSFSIESNEFWSSDSAPEFCREFSIEFLPKRRLTSSKLTSKWSNSLKNIFSFGQMKKFEFSTKTEEIFFDEPNRKVTIWFFSTLLSSTEKFLVRWELYNV